MFAELLIATALEIGPFYEQRTDFCAVRPFWSAQDETVDVLWPVFTSHRDWWRFCWFTHFQTNDSGYQFEIMPFWCNGTDGDESYWAFFPFYGRHPHFLTLDDWEFCMWPLWHRYRTPRRDCETGAKTMMTSNAVLFPFFTWRDDGSWGFWPFYGVNRQRESEHHYAFWPVWTWADYGRDRDTGGEGWSWMFWPLYGMVERERESQWLALPPLFSYCRVPDGWRLRCPWPLCEIERRSDRDRTAVIPFYENVEVKGFLDGSTGSSVTRYGWRLVEIYRDECGEVVESRVFPFWKRNVTHTRIWPFWEAMSWNDLSWCGAFAIFPITWADSVDRNWAKFWTFYESLSNPVYTDHSLFWGIIRWRTVND